VQNLQKVMQPDLDPSEFAVKKLADDEHDRVGSYDASTLASV